MKHSFVRLPALAAALILALALAGCGGETTGGNPAVSSQPAGSVPASSTPASSIAAGPAPAGGSRYASLEEYWADPARRKAFEAGFAAGFGSNEDDAAFSFEAEGNTLVCTFQFTDASVDYSGLGSVIDAAMDANAGALIPLAGLLDDEIGAKEGTCIIVMRYLDPDGTLLSETSYTALDEVPELPNGAAGSIASLEDYFQKNPAVREQLEEQLFAMGTDQFQVVSLDVSGNVFTITYQFTDPSLMVDGLTELLEQGLDAQADFFEQEAAAFDSFIASGHSTVVIRYLDLDGGLLTQREFTAG